MWRENFNPLPYQKNHSFRLEIINIFFIKLIFKINN